MLNISQVCHTDGIRHDSIRDAFTINNGNIVFSMRFSPLHLFLHMFNRLFLGYLPTESQICLKLIHLNTILYVRPRSVKIVGEELQRMHHFKYLGSSVEERGGMTTEITQRVSAAWSNWKRYSGVLCDRRMPVKLKGKVYKTVVRPALLYGAETWATTRGQEARLEVNEMRMLRWMCGVTRRDKIRNENIRGTTRVVQASQRKLQKND